MTRPSHLSHARRRSSPPVCRTPAAAEGCKPRLDRAHAQQAPDAGGHLQGVSTLQRPRPRGHRHGPLRAGGARPEELAEPPG